MSYASFQLPYKRDDVEKSLDMADSTLEFTKDRVYKKYYYRFDKFEHSFKMWYDVDGGYENHNLEKIDEYRNRALIAYKLAKVFGLIVHGWDNDYILTSMQRYPKVLIDCHVDFTVEDLQSKMEGLVRDLVKHGLVHTDFAFRNICVDNDNGLHLIDFEELQTGNMLEKDLIWLTYVESDFQQHRLVLRKWLL